MYIAIKTFDKPCSDQFNLHTFEPHKFDSLFLLDYKSIALQGHTNYVLIN